MMVPSPDFTVQDVKHIVGSKRIVDIMDVKTQQGFTMTMKEFAKYYKKPPEQRKRLLNVISLEVSHSQFDKLVKRPEVVNYLDWIDLAWPLHLKNVHTEQTNDMNLMKYPKVQKYCLMSVQGCYTDFHIDFGGTSVWYHILRGSKYFWIVKPTEDNLMLYERWIMSGNQGGVFFADMVTECQLVKLEAGDTFMIPSGWIHSVYTPEDSLVFGGNFLNSFTIPMQLEVSALEHRTKVPNRFKFPFYNQLHWYVLDRYVFSLRGKSFMTKEFKKLNNVVEKNRLFKNDVVANSMQSNNDLNSVSTEQSNTFYIKVENESFDIASKKLTVGSEPKANYVNLTKLELIGLKKLLNKLKSLPVNKRDVPEGIADAEGLLLEATKVLEEHSDDETALAINGKAVASWPVLKEIKSFDTNIKVLDTTEKKIKKKRKRAPNGAPKPPKVVKTGKRIRRVRCKQCEACRREDCRTCVFCKDMKKYGGPGTMKQTCQARRCLNPLLPKTVIDRINVQNNLDSNKTVEDKNCLQNTVVNESLHKNNEFEAREPDSKIFQNFIDTNSNIKLEPKIKTEVQENIMCNNQSPKKDPTLNESVSFLNGSLFNCPKESSSDESSEDDYTKEFVSTQPELFKSVDIRNVAQVPIDFAEIKKVVEKPSEVKNDLQINNSEKFSKNKLNKNNLLDLKNTMITKDVLKLVVKTAPSKINLEGTQISYSQLSWILSHVESLRSLNISRNSSSIVRALLNDCCPLLEHLDISYMTHFDDDRLRSIFLNPKNLRPGRVISQSKLGFCNSINLSGLFLSEVSFKLVASRMMYLESLNVSFTDITDAAVDFVCKERAFTLTKFTARGCNRLTNNVVVSLKNLNELLHVDLTDCKLISGGKCLSLCSKHKLLSLKNSTKCLSAIEDEE